MARNRLYINTVNNGESNKNTNSCNWNYNSTCNNFNTVGSMTEEKECSKCEKVKPTSDFYAYRNGLQPHCKPCSMIYVAAMRKANVTVRKSACKFNNIALYLEAKGISGDWIAKQVGRDKGVFFKWARNETQPPMHLLFAVADAMNVPPSVLINNDAQQIDKKHSANYIMKEAFARFPIIYNDKTHNDINFIDRTNWIDGYNAALDLII
jgi:hypothetical protein